jgi:predicted XRE-type DNA-binding protein
VSNTTKFTKSSGNVFADLGLPDAEELRAKADLAYQIGQIIDERDLTQDEAADLLGIDQPKVSALRRGRLSGFSMERLYRFLNALGKDVEIVVRPSSQAQGHATVRVLTAGRPRAGVASVARKSARAKVAPRKGSPSAKKAPKRNGSSRQRT